MPERLVESVLDGTAVAASDLVAEANHRIANNLAIIAGLIRAQVLKIPLDAPVNPLEVRTSLEQMSLRIDAVGRLHRLLMNSAHSAGSIELTAYLREIADVAMCSLANIERTEILFNFETPALVSAKQAAAIGLLAGEALINSLKHAHPPEAHGTIWIACKQRGEDTIMVELSDDGVGLRADASGSQAGSGIRLMRGLADQLNARLEFINGNRGLTVRLELPAAMPNATAREGRRDTEMAMVVARAKLTEVVLDTEAQGHGAFVASILLLKGTRLYHLTAPNLPAAYTAAIDGIEIGRTVGSCGTAAYCGHPVYVADIANDPLWTGYPEIKKLALDAGLKACWSMPVFYSGKVLGTFAIYHREVRNPTVAERQLIRDAAASAAGLLAQVSE